uniref:Cyclin N-terminal domain-containing protein n=1 Tax=Oncorhynchus mykiss TaxID=8022 RepID=A0A8K9UM04_ONCMY
IVLLNVELKVQTKSEENVSLPGKPATSYIFGASLNNCFIFPEKQMGVHVKPPQSQETTWVEGLNVPQAFSHALLNIPDVDSANAGASSLCSDYVKDFYAYLRKLEGCDVTGSMWSILVDWLVHVQRQLTALVFSSARDYPVPKKSLQLVGVTARLIAYKYEEIAPPMVEDFAHTTDLTYSCAEILHFLRRAAKLLPVGYGLAKYLLVLTLLDYASTPALQHYMGYTEVSLLPVMQCIAKMLECLNDGNKQLSIKQKYENVKLLQVSCLPELASTRAYAYINKLANCHC